MTVNPLRALINHFSQEIYCAGILYFSFLIDHKRVVVNYIFKRIRIFLFLFALLLLAGCGKSPGETVDGEVILGTTQFTEGDKIVVLIGNETNNYSGEANADNKFQFKDVVRGTYKVRLFIIKSHQQSPRKALHQVQAHPRLTQKTGPFPVDRSNLTFPL